MNISPFEFQDLIISGLNYIKKKNKTALSLGLFSFAEYLITRLNCFLVSYLYCPYSQELLNTFYVFREESIVVQSINEIINAFKPNSEI